ncbi:hypothetical protein [Intestinimonas butyriciproducens]|uniref:hypothetical protein n=1 Tax=Intestinimonas butyriciproducens TaxID=1297617 RepID=UPI002672052E|nr:hypothetical protein [Intestinimonas butyriciproducens]
MEVIFLISNKAFIYHAGVCLLISSLVALACGLALPETWMTLGAIAGIICSPFVFYVAKHTKN